MRNHFLQLPYNTQGKDYFIGALDGSIIGLIEVLKKLGPHDRLFCAGKIFDLNFDDLSMLYKLRDLIKQEENKNKIFITRGTSEKKFLMGVAALWQHQNQQSLDTTDCYSLLDFWDNGGHKIFDRGAELFRAAFLELLPSLNALPRHCQENKSTEITLADVYAKQRETAQTLLDLHLKNTTMNLTELENLAKWFASFPYIIVIGDLRDKKRGRLVAHASIPLSDAEIMERLSKKDAEPTLTTAEIAATIYGKFGDPNNARHSCDCMSFVGRAFLDTPSLEDIDEDTTLITAPPHPVHSTSNTVNLFSNPRTRYALLMAEHATSTTTIVEMLPTELMPDTVLLSFARTEISAHLKMHHDTIDLIQREADLAQLESELKTHLAALTSATPGDGIRLLTPRTSQTEKHNSEQLLAALDALRKNQFTTPAQPTLTGTISTALMALNDRFQAFNNLAEWNRVDTPTDLFQL